MNPGPHTRHETSQARGIGSKSVSRLRIAYLTVNDPTDRRSWSGTQYYMAQALQRHCGDVTALGPIRPASMFLRKVLRRALKIVGKRYLFTHSVAFANATARIAEHRLATTKCDLIFAPAGSAQVAYVKTDIPIVYLSDTTFSAILNYYPEFSGISPAAIREANAIEQLGIDRARIIIYSSSWAAESARRDYRADSSKVRVVPFGANLDQTPPIERVLNKARSGVCKLLFVGVDWTKKGGEIALETLVELERLGVPAELTIVGCAPPKRAARTNLRVFRTLNKNIPDEKQKLEALYLDSDFFLLPTRADCSPIVLCEAGAYGLPSICTDTGGVSEIIRDGDSGILLPLSARGDQYARVIAEIFADGAKHQQMRRHSRESYDTRLNWNAWGRAVADILAELGLSEGAS